MAHNPLQLPPLADGSRLSIDNATRQLVIVGANGAGKSRFAARMASEPDNQAFQLSALNAIFNRDRSSGPSLIDRLYEDAAASGMPHEADSTQLERVMALLMRDEMLNLISYKLRHATDRNASLRPTRLDSVISMWQEIFPDNKVLIESGRVLFSRRVEEHSAGYSAVKLSAGEKAVIYYLGAITYAPEGATIFVDSPEIFLHPTIMQSVWNRIELLRPDCRFVYTTHDLDFAASRTAASVIWVRDYDAENSTWHYEILPPRSAISDEIYMAIIGARKPVLFIEGDGKHSIDSKLYPLIFKDYTVQSLGSCNKVIESTRTFNDLKAFHHMDSYGIVDRDRRDQKEVEYLRGKRVMVPDVAEIENILMLEEVIRTVAHRHGKQERNVFERVKKAVMTQFRHDLRQQALLHTRHRVKRTVEYRIDGRFTNINQLEQHMLGLMNEINPRGLYEEFCRTFNRYIETDDYRSVLRVYNQKSMLPGSNVAGLCGLRNKDEYLKSILSILRNDDADAERIRTAVKACFNIDDSKTAPDHEK